MSNQKTTHRRHQRGVAAVEFALTLPAILLLLSFALFFGRLFWHYTVALKAAGDVATFVALARSVEMTESRSDLGEVGIVTLARSIGTAELAELNPGNDGYPLIDISCDGFPCRGAQVPEEIGVLVQMKLFDVFLPALTSRIGNTDGMWLRAEVRVRYAGS